MSPTAEFHMADTRPRHDSGESIMTDSDFEGFEAEGWSSSDISRYHWLGKRVFEYILTEVVFDESEPSSTAEALDSAVMMKMASYPFEERSNQLGELMPSSSRLAARLATQDAFRKFVTLLGSIYNSATDETKKRVTTLINEGRSDSAAYVADPSGGAEGTAPTISHVEAQGHGSTDGGLNRHTSALNRYCDREGIAVDWPTVEVPSARAKFRCTARVGEHEFKGVGKNTRDARHNASRKACIAFGIEV